MFFSNSIIIFLFIFLFKLSNCDVNKDVELVKLENGNSFVGIEQESFYTKKPFVEFRGIPYARPPVGQFRFKPTVAYDEIWTEVRQAKEFGSVCPQDDVLNEIQEDGHLEEIVQVVGNEDCLFLNIATPTRSLKNNLLPVVVWIHGGSFQYESGDAYGVHKFMEHELIFVTFNFRIGVLGFLNNGDESIQGNMGLKDQVLALKWIRDNIKSFGGNPNEITLMGVNAGAISAHLHMLSPMSEGLFHRVILQSGTAISPWGFSKNPKRTSNLFHSWVNCSSENETIPMYDCLMSLDTESIIRKQPRLVDWYIDPLVPVGPSVEIEGEEQKFLDDDPYKIITSGNYWAKDKVSIIAGINSDEGLLHSWDIMHHPTLPQTLNMEWHRAIPITLAYLETVVDWKAVSNSIFDFYFNRTSSDDLNLQERFQEQLAKEEGAPTPDKSKWDNPKLSIRGPLGKKSLIGQNFHQFKELTEMYSDRYFNIPLHKMAKLHGGNDNAKVYLYWLDYQGEQSSTQISGYNDTIVGVSHYDQIQYLFNTPYFKDPTKEEDVEFAKRFVKGLVQFITHGKPPAGEWVKVTREMVEGTVPLIYNRFGSLKDSYQLIERFTSSVEFWDTLSIAEYGKTIEELEEIERNQNNLDNDKESAGKIEL